MNFEKDIFISYAHLDNHSGEDGMQGWITEFENHIRQMVGEITGEPPVIWRDERLQGNDEFALEIVDQFSKLKVMISIVTPRYVKSEWCTKEVEAFYKAADQTGGISVGNKWRIFKIHKTPVDLNAEPEKIRKLLGYDFYKVDPSTDKFTPYDKSLGPEMAQAFNAKLLDVAQDIAKLISNLSSATVPALSGSNSEAAPPTVNVAPAASNENAKRKIFLADTTSDLKEFHDIVKRALEDKGYTVFPNKNLNRDTADSFTSDAESFIKDSSLSIHLIGSPYGSVPEGTDKSIPVIQNEIAAKASAERGMNRLIWIHSITDNDAKQQSFIDQLRHREELQQDSDLLEGTIDDFKLAIFDNITKQEAKEKAEALEKAKQKERIAAPVSPAAGETPRIIYMICDERDLDDIMAIQEFLNEKGHEVMLPSFGGDVAQLKQEHDENLKTCDAVILYWGKADFNWANSKKNDLIRLRGVARPQPMLSQIAYLANPAIPQKEGFKSVTFTVVNGVSGFNPQLLNDFIEKLK